MDDKTCGNCHARVDCTEDIFDCDKCGEEICAYCNYGDPEEGTDLCENCAADADLDS